MNSPKISECAVNFLRASVDPFGYRTTGSADLCIPDTFDMPSQKLSAFTRATVTIGTGGVGFISFNPFVISQNWNSIAASTSAYTGTVFWSPNAVPVAGVSQIPIPSLPWTSTVYPDFRVVAAGVRLRYTGTELNRGGLIVPATALASGDTLHNQNISATLARPVVEPHPCNRKWHGCIYRAMHPDQTSYSSGTTGNTDAVMGIIVNGTAGNTYEAEVIVYFEAISTSTYKVMNVSASHSDVNGYSMVRNAFQSLSDSAIGQSAYQYAVQGLKAYAQSSLTSTLPLLAHGAL